MKQVVHALSEAAAFVSADEVETNAAWQSAGLPVDRETIGAQLGLEPTRGERRLAPEGSVEVATLDSGVLVRVWLAEPLRAHVIDEALFEVVTEGLYLFDADLRVIDVNPAATRLTGWSREELLEMDALALVDRDTRHVYESFAETLRTEPRFEGLAQGVRKDDTRFEAEITGVPLKVDGRVLFLASVRDITPVRKVMRAIERSEARSRRALEASGSGYWEFDLQTGGQFTSEAVERLYGGPLPSLEAWLSMGHAEDSNSLKRAWQSHVDGLMPRVRVERRVADGFGEWRWLDESAFVYLRDEDGLPRRVAGSVSDITSRKAREHEARSEFSYVVSHDLTEPVRTIKSFIELVLSDHGEALDDEALAFLRYAHEASTRMGSLVADLLRYTRVGASAPAERLNPADAARDALADLSARLETIPHDVRVDRIPDCLANDNRMRLVFANLFSNAVKFRAPDQPVRIHVSGMRRGNAVRITVDDGGIGIPEKQRDRVFRVFQRLHRRDRIPGSGIGLAIVKRVIEQAGGRIWVDRPPKGWSTRIVMELPAAS